METSGKVCTAYLAEGEHHDKALVESWKVTSKPTNSSSLLQINAL